MKRPRPKARTSNSSARQLVILTGLSGSGKGSVLNTFEDLGFYCVDNLPVALIPTFSELYVEGESDTYLYRLVFQGLLNASLSPADSRHLIRRTANERWS